MDFPKLKALLASSESKHILKALIDIRTRVVKSQSGLEGLLEENFVTNLVSLLNRSNPKIIDISLSILANLLQEELARKQIRSCGGIVKLINIVQNIEDNNILCRAWRAVANAAQDTKNIALLHQHGLASHLSQALVSLSDSHSQVVLVRCARIAGDTARHRGYLVAEGALDRVVNILVSLEDETNHDLCKAVAKCLAKLSHGARLEEAEKILPGVAALVRMAGSARRDLAENCLGVLVNLSQLDQLRPCLGNAEVVDILVTKFYSCEANSKLKNSVITALCLYCRESVNRVKLREVAGCKLFVEVLSSDEEEMLKLQDMVLNSLLQFIYDNHSLNVLMNEGLIPSLVQMLGEYTVDFKQEHKCDIIENTEGPSESNDIEIKDELTVTDEELIDPTFNNENVDQDETPSSDTVKAEVDDLESDPKSDSNPGPVFRINSPSYQAVQYELEQFMQLRHSRDLNTSGSGSPRWPLSSPAYSGCPSPQSPPSSPLDWTPLSPSSSICQSPDRSPPPLSCGFSPSSSDTGHSPIYSPTCHSPESSRSLYSPMLYSPSASPPYSPPEPNYSPIENFSDEESEDNKDEHQDEKGDEKQKAISEPVTGQNLTDVQLDHSSKAVTPVENIDEPQPSTSGGVESIGPSLLPWTKRTLKIQRTHTYLGQTFTLPPRTRSPSPSVDSPAKRPKLSPTQAYQYAASPLPSSKSNSNLPRQLSRLSVGPPQKVKKPFSRIPSIMQILARLSQAERPHADLTSTRTISCIFSYMSLVHTGVEKSAKIMNRLSTNLYCLFPFILSRHYSYLSLILEDLAESTSQLGCSKCSDNFQEVKKVIQSVGHNLTLLAETGFGEGEICHRLVHPLASKEDKQFISLSAALLVRQRKMLRNILITHDSLDLLLDILEAENDKKVDEAENDEKKLLTSSLFSQAVLSVSHLAAHLGVVSPSLTLPEQITGECHRSSSTAEDNLTLVLDDGSSLAANKEILCNSCPVFAAMFSGSFSESGQSSIPLPHTSSPALSCLLHYLYTCHLCQQFSSLAVTTLLELVSLSDKYLLPDLNLAVSHCIIRRFVSGPDLVDLYRLALQKKYPVQCGGNPGTLAQATVCTLLVGDMPTRDRVELFRKLVCSQLSGDFIDDVGKMLREKLLERS